MTVRIWDEQAEAEARLRAAAVPVPDVIDLRTPGQVSVRRRPVVSGTAIGALVAGIAGVVLGLRPLQDNSFITHLATGRLILERMAIPGVDPYSFTAEGSDWIVQSWLASVLYAGAEKIGGDAGLQLLIAAVTTALTLLVWRLTRSAEAFSSRLVTLILVVTSCASLWGPRPFMIGLVLFGLCLVVAEEDRWPAWSLIPIGWVWVNTHGTFPLVLAYLAVRIVGRRFDGEPVQRHLRLLGCAAAGIAAGAVGPLGLSALTFPLHLMDRSEALKAVVEWKSPDFSSLPNLLFLGLAMCAFVLPKRRRWEDLLPSAAFVVLAATGLRHIPWAALVLVPAVARALPFRGVEGGRRRGPLDAVVAVLLIGVCGVAGAARLGQEAYDFRRDLYPLEELAWMAANGLDTRSTRVALPDYVGNYLEWRDGAEANVFFDDRFDMYPLHVVEAHRVLFAGEAGWDEALDRYGIEAVLWPQERALAQLLKADARWQVVHQSAGWIVAARR